MRIMKKLAAAAALVMAITTLAACGEQEIAPAQSAAPRSTTFESKPAPSPQSSAPASSNEPEQSAPPVTSLPDGFPENLSEASLKYYESAVGIVDNYLFIVMGNLDEEQQAGLDYNDYNNPEYQEKVKQYLIDCANKGEGFLDELEQLTPTDEMSAFHNELVGVMNILRGFTVIVNGLEDVNLTDENAADKFNMRLDVLLERFNNEYRAFYVKYPDFGKSLAHRKWQRGGATAASYFVSDLEEEAERCAKCVSYTLSDWLPEANDKSALANATLEIINTKNGCEITGAALGDKDLEELKQVINASSLVNAEFWAMVCLREDGSPSFVLFSLDGKLDDSELNGGAGLAGSLLEWRGTGVTPEGHIVGTFGAPPTSEPQ